MSKSQEAFSRSVKALSLIMHTLSSRDDLVTKVSNKLKYLSFSAKIRS